MQYPKESHVAAQTKRREREREIGEAEEGGEFKKKRFAEPLESS